MAMTPRHLDQAWRAARTGATLRVVGRARLKLAEGSHEARARFLLEDALSTADFQDLGRLVVVRRLCLPRFAAGANSRSVTLALERVWRDASIRAVAFDDPRGPDADIVFAPDAETARAALLGAVVSGGDTRAWYWPSLVPDFRPAESPALNALRLIAATLGHEPAWRALASAMVTWPRQRMQALMDLLPADAPPEMSQFEQLRPANGYPQSKARSDGSPAREVAPGNSATGAPAPRPDRFEFAAVGLAAAALANLVAPPGGQQLACDWRVRLLAVAVWTTTHHGIPDTRQVDAVFRAWSVRERAASHSHSPPAAPEPKPSGPVVEVPSSSPIRRPPPRSFPGPGTPQRAPHDAEGVRDVPARGAPREPIASPLAPWLPDAEETEAGGLLMVANVLRHLRFDDWIGLQASHCRWPLVAALFTAFLDRISAPAGDPLRRLFVLDRALEEMLTQSETRWNGFAWAAWLGWRMPHDSQSGERSLRWWMAAVRRALRRACGLNLAQLLRRKAWIHATDTNVDVIFALADADMTIRRAGLDADPGWVSWLGYIIGFHFLEPPGGHPYA